MSKDRKRFPLGTKMYLFIAITVFAAAFGAALVSYAINVNQIDDYFKRLSYHSAENFATFVDGDYLMKLRELAETEEYQKLRDSAEEADDEEVIEKYLSDHGLWEDYVKNRGLLIRYLRNMKDLKYLYIITLGDENADHDMYLMDDDDNPIYTTGYYEVREPEFEGVKLEDYVEPTINNGDWGWLCSSYAPVFDSAGNLVCHIGCDVAMDGIMEERRNNLVYVILSASIFTLLVLIAAVYLANHTMIHPLKALTEGMKKFSPSENKTYEEAGVIDLDIKNHDEIRDIYDEVHSIQTRIIDYLHDMVDIQKQKEKAENEMKIKEKELGQMSREALRDSLTGVGNKTAYTKKIAELNEQVMKKEPGLAFAIVMVDVNCLKIINDNYGHSAGDTYLRGCCHVICEAFKHSPVFRIGGDEFISILHAEDYERRFEKLKNLMDVFEKAYNDKEVDPWFRYSAAAGMAELASDDSTVELVFKRADQAMYNAKVEFKRRNGMEAR